MAAQSWRSTEVEEEQEEEKAAVPEARQKMKRAPFRAGFRADLCPCGCLPASRTRGCACKRGCLGSERTKITQQWLVKARREPNAARFMLRLRRTEDAGGLYLQTG